MKYVKMLDDNIDLGFDMFPKRPEGMDPVRSEGVHLTDIIKDIMIESHIQKTMSGSVWKEDQLHLAGEVGFMWEEILSSALKNRLPCRIGELELDGILLSPDGIEVDEVDGEPILSEYKSVWSSSKREPIDNWKWMAQTKGYCKALGLTKVRMYILYLMGDYKGGGPQYRKCTIEFTELEIEENWEMLVNHARHKGWLQ